MHSRKGQNSTQDYFSIKIKALNIDVTDLEGEVHELTAQAGYFADQNARRPFVSIRIGLTCKASTT